MADDEITFAVKGLQPTGKISPQPWMTAPETRTIVDALTAGEADVRFVGGCVRDGLAHRPLVEDLDIATPEPPDVVMGRLEDAGIKALPTGIEHGTVTAIIGERRFEVTSLRVDVETDGRRARVAYTDDWIEDARRRDFTINAMSCSLEGDVYDPFDGIADLAHGRVRFVGLAHERIAEDVLRLLRFFRFHGTYGRPPPDRDALAACRNQAHKLPQLSAERVRDELLRILMTTDPAEIVLLMRGHGVLEHVLPEAGDTGRLRMVTWIVTRGIRLESVRPDPVRRLAALLDTDAARAPGAADAIARRLRLSNRESARLQRLLQPFDVGPESDVRARDQALQRLGAETVRDLALLAWASELAITPRLAGDRGTGWTRLLEAVDGWTPKVFPLRGADLLARGVPHGPSVGALLASVETWWEDGGYTADRDACLERLEAVLAEGE